MNPSKIKLLFLVFFSVFYLAGCKDLIDKDISKNQLVIQSPPDNFITNNFNATFVWEDMDGASRYRLQIVQPSFDSIKQLLIDTLVAGTIFTNPLLPGKYQWRIRGENGSSTTAYITRHITIDTNSNLNGQIFTVVSPSDNTVTNSNIMNFSWQIFPSANLYEYNLLNTNGTVLKDKTTPQALTADTLTEGTFLWQVRALNTVNNSATLYSTARTIVVDFTPPVPSGPLTPFNNSADTNSVSLTWNRPADVFADSLFIGTDSLLQNNFLNVYIANNQSYLLPTLTLNTYYYWRLRSRDLAGNWSIYSATYRFKVIR